MTTVTPTTFIRAETDRYFWNISRQAGGVNRFFHYREPTPLAQQTVVRMNRDTLYSMSIVDTSQGASITVPAVDTGRYASVYLADNDHYTPFVIYDPGTHALPRDTQWLGVGVRIQVFNPDDAAEVRLVNHLQDQFVIDASSAEEFGEPDWDVESLTALREEYESEFQKFERFPSDWQGARGEANESTRHLAAAGAWGLFPSHDATYINYAGDHDASACHAATYDVPENNAFWSITVYGADGYMKHRNSIVNSSSVVLDDDGRFTVHFGSSQACSAKPTNRLDVSDGWNFLMRVYRPGTSVLDGSYVLPAAVRHA